MSRAFIAVAGVMGVGKSTLARRLANHYNIPFYHEPFEDNFYIERNYAGEDVAFELQLMQLILLHKNQALCAHTGGILDCVTELSLATFARQALHSGKLDRHEYQSLTEVCRLLGTPQPRVCFQLTAEPAVIMERIKGRARGMESFVTKEFIEELCVLYQSWCDRDSVGDQLRITIDVSSLTADEVFEAAVEVLSMGSVAQ